MVINPAVFFLVVLCVYGVCHVLQSKASKKVAV
jgi:hypothetical protein